ncbi:hypothetical protein, partial [Salegentibacter maritimus]
NQGAIYDEILSIIGNESDVLVDNNNGTYTHTAVDGTAVIIDANTTSVSVTDGVYTFTDASGNTITTIDTNASASGYDNTNSGLTSTNVQDALDEIQSNLDNTTDVLVANGNGTYTHTTVDGTEVIIDANTTSVSVTDGVYTFTDASGNTITTIDTNASAVSFDNTTNILTATNVQTAIEELLATVNTSEGDLSLDGGLEFISGTDGLSKLLADAGIQVADAGISTAKLADGAVTTNKIQGVGNDQIMATDATGNVTWIDKSGVGEILEAKNGLTKSALDIKLGGALIEPTSITTDATNTLAVAGLQPGTANDQLVVAEADGTLRQVKSAMPKFFYMPSVVFDTSTQGTSFTRNLHQEYVNQFGSPMVSSAGASAAIPTLPANELEYHITYYDTTVFANVSVDGNGVLTYDIISSTNSAASFMNIVFVVK